MILAGSCALGATAQDASTTSPSPNLDANQRLALQAKVMAMMAAQIPSCPVGFNATRAGMPVMRSIAGDRGNSLAPRRDGPLVDISFFDHLPQRIASVKLVLHGISAQQRLVPAYATPPEDIAEVFHLDRIAGHNQFDGAELQMRQSGIVSRVELTEIQFTDGTTWHPSDSSHCSVRPSGLVLVK
jgi:hypothetical protein